MKKVLFLLLSLLFTLLLASCDYSIYPSSQDGTIWVCENPKMYFTVDYNRPNDEPVCLGRLFDEKDIVFTSSFQGNGGELVDIIKMNNKSYSYSEAIIIRGRNKFNKKEFTLTVTESNIDLIAVDDIITFHRIDGLPEWVLEIITNYGQESAEVEEIE